MSEDRSVLGRAARTADRVWRYGAGPDRVADLFLPPNGNGGRVPVVLVHGGYWRPEYDRVHLRPMAEALAAAGHPALLVGYSRIPGDPDATVADLRLALAGASAVLPGPAPVLVGHSAGGHLALVLAADPDTPALACLALAPVADLVEAERLDLDDGAARAFLGGEAAQRPDLDPRRLPIPRIPVTVVHGEADTLVPPALSAAYARTTGARHVRLAGTGHFEVIDPASAAWPAVMAELSALTAAAGIE
jgi:acetyl esterase/lipase